MLFLLLVNSGGRERGIEESMKLFSFSAAAAAAAAARRCLRFWGIVCIFEFDVDYCKFFVMWKMCRVSRWK